MNVLFLAAPNETRLECLGALGKAGFRVDVADSCHTATQLLRNQAYALILLDVVPVSSIQSSIVALRRISTAPLLVLTERDRLSDRLQGLALGATDYLVKPCAMDKLLTRAWALTPSLQEPASALLRLADLVVDNIRRKAFRQNIDLGLSSTLFELLNVMMAQRGKLVSRHDLTQAVWGVNSDQADNKLLVAVFRLRQKLDDPFQQKLIHTVPGKGYVLDLQSMAARCGDHASEATTK